VPGPKSGVASYLAGGWELGTIVTATSGSPFTVTYGGGGDPLNTGFNGDFSMDFPNLVAGCNPIHGGVTYLNLSCFALAPTVPNGVLVGNAGRNRFYGPGLKTVDLSAFKNIRIVERLKLQFRAEFFNILNHPNLSGPNFLNDANNSVAFDASGIPVPKSAGVLASTSTSSRQIQLGLKLIW
jgi:hypothetical protein